MNVVRFVRTLGFYDWIVAFEAVDEAGNRYFAEDQGWFDDYLMVRCPTEWYFGVMAGDTPLREIFAEAQEYYKTDWVNPPWQETSVSVYQWPLEEYQLPSPLWRICPTNLPWEEYFPFRNT